MALPIVFRRNVVVGEPIAEDAVFGHGRVFVSSLT
jgi:hypothetical protein